MHLDYLNYFAVFLRGINGQVDICQHDYSTYSKRKILPYSEVIHRVKTFKQKKG